MSRLNNRSGLKQIGSIAPILGPALKGPRARRFKCTHTTHCRFYREQLGPVSPLIVESLWHSGIRLYIAESITLLYSPLISRGIPVF